MCTAHPQGAKEVYHILIYIFNEYKSTSCGFQATCLVRGITGGFLYGTSNFISRTVKRVNKR